MGTATEGTLGGPERGYLRGVLQGVPVMPNDEHHGDVWDGFNEHSPGWVGLRG